MSAISDVQITFGGVLAPREFRRIPDSLNAGSGATKSFLWTSKTTAAAPIVDVAVLYDAEEPPAGEEGWQKLPADVTKGAMVGQTVHLAIRRRTEGVASLGVKEVAVLYDEDPVPGTCHGGRGGSRASDRGCACNHHHSDLSGPI
jgi:hypothetical protein